MWITQLSTFDAIAQNSARSSSFVSVFDDLETRADRYYEQFEYASAVKLYEKLVEKEPNNEMAKLRLAESYVKINQPVEAEQWYSQVIHSDIITADHLLQYAQTLLATGDYSRAREIIEQHEFARLDQRGKAIISTLDRLENFYADSTHYKLEAINSKEEAGSDFSPAFYKDGKVVFVSSRNKKGKRFKWDDTPFLDLFTLDEQGTIKPFSNRLNSKYHEGPLVFTNNFQQIIFTRSNYFEGQLGETEEGVNNLQLYTAQWNEKIKDWDNIKPISFNIDQYSFGHPTISADEKTLYFISDMPGGFGGTDIYASHHNGTEWGAPVNLGEGINTPGNEMYPHVYQDQLFFASTGHGGLGGLDVYQTEFDNPGDIKNMGYPINTPGDDFGLAIQPEHGNAYLSSNRTGKDRIYHLDLNVEELPQLLADNSVYGDPINPDQDQLLLANVPDQSTNVHGEDLVTLNTTLIDQEGQALLPGATLQLLVDDIPQQEVIVDEDGKASFDVVPGKDYQLLATKDGYENKKIELPAQSMGSEEDLLIALKPDSIDPISGQPIENFDELSTDYGAVTPVALKETPNELSTKADNQVNTVNGQEYDINAPVPGEQPTINGVALREAHNVDNLDGEDANLLITNEFDPEVSGVALNELGADEQTVQRESAQELDPVAVSDERLLDNELATDEQPSINGVALREAHNVDNLDGEDANLLNTNEFDPEVSGVAGNELPTEDQTAQRETTQELDPLAVNDERLLDNELATDEQPSVNGVALRNSYDVDDIESQQENLLNGNEFDPAVSGVALNELPTEDQTAQRETTQELDPLAVSDERLLDNELVTDERPSVKEVALQKAHNVDNFDGEDANLLNTNEFDSAVSGVALNEAPTDQTTQREATQELDPLAVSDERLLDNELSTDKQPSVNEVALRDSYDVDDIDSQQENLLDGNEFDPAVSGVALNELGADEQTVQRETNQELDALAVSDERLLDNELATDKQPSINGVALRDSYDVDDIDSQQENLLDGNEFDPAVSGVALNEAPTDQTTQREATQELDPLAVSDERLLDNELATDKQPSVNGVALREAHNVDNLDGEGANLLNTNEFDPAVSGVALNELPTEDQTAQRETTQELDLLAVSDERLLDNELVTDERPSVKEVALQKAHNVDNFDGEDANLINTNEFDSAVSGVALNEAPTDQTTQREATQELDPLAVSDERLLDNELATNEQPSVDGVAPRDSYDVDDIDSQQENLLDGKEFDPAVSGVALNELGADEQTVQRDAAQELDALAVSDERLLDNELATDKQSSINGVALRDSYDVDDIDSQQENLLDGNEFDPAVSGVALNELPTEDQTAQRETTQELDPLAVSDERLLDNELVTDERPSVNGVALRDSYDVDDIESQQENLLDGNEFDPAASGVALNELGADEQTVQRETNQELDALAVSDERLLDNELATNEQPSVNGVALRDSYDVDDIDSQQENLLDGNEFDPAVSGVALNEAPTDQTTQREATQELDPLAVSDERLLDNELATNERPSVNGVALRDSYDVDDIESQQENLLDGNEFDPAVSGVALNELGADDQTAQREANQELDALAISDERLLDNELTTDERPSVNGVALRDSYDVDDIDSQHENLLDGNEFDPAVSRVALGNSNNVDGNELQPMSSRQAQQMDAEHKAPSPVDKVTLGGSADALPKLVDARVTDAETAQYLQDAEVKLFVDDPDRSVSYELRDGVLTFEPKEDEDYMLIASHPKYQDQYINLSGADLLSNPDESINLTLSKEPEDIKGQDPIKVKTLVRNYESGEIIEGAQVSMFVDGKAMNLGESNKKGKETIKAVEGKDYLVMVTKEGYQDLIYHVPADQHEDLELDLQMMEAYADEPQIAGISGNSIFIDEATGEPLPDVSFEVYDDGKLIEETENAANIAWDEPGIQVVASKAGFKDQIVEAHEVQDANVVMQPESISEASLNEAIEGPTVTWRSVVQDHNDEQPLKDAEVNVFADGRQIQTLRTWDDGVVEFEAEEGVEYTLQVNKPGYQNQLNVIRASAENLDDTIELAPLEEELSSIDLSSAEVLKLSNQQGQEEIFVEHEGVLYEYQEEQDKSLLIHQEDTIVLTERHVNLNSKITDDTDSDLYNLRNEDQFKYDQLSSEEKATVDQLVEHGVTEGTIASNPDLNIIYQSLPTEVQTLIDQRIVVRSNSLASPASTSPASTSPASTSPASTSPASTSPASTSPASTSPASTSPASTSPASTPIDVEALSVNNIYYDFDKSNIREDAALELDRVAELMLTHKDLKLSFWSHTDSRGSQSYNQKLSQRRAQAVVDYLVAQGIDENRLIGDSRGETELANQCFDDISCSEDAHQLNRRTEFRFSV